MSRVLYLIGAAAPPVRQIDQASRQAIAGGWNPFVILTPTAATWVDLDAIERASGNPVRVHPRLPGEDDPPLPAAAVLAAPLTFNAINKWATGISDNLALGLLNELLGADVPITVVPCANSALRSHPAYQPNLELLEHAGVKILREDALACRGNDGQVRFDWASVLASVSSLPHRT